MSSKCFIMYSRKSSLSTYSGTSRFTLVARARASSGWRTRETYSPPGGDAHDRPWRPFPALCRFATRIVPSSAPWPRRSFAISFVESTASNRRSLRKIGPGRSSIAAGCGRDASATVPREAGRRLSLCGGGRGSEVFHAPDEPEERDDRGERGEQEE